MKLVPSQGTDPGDLNWRTVAQQLALSGYFNPIPVSGGPTSVTANWLIGWYQLSLEGICFFTITGGGNTGSMSLANGQWLALPFILQTTRYNALNYNLYGMATAMVGGVTAYNILIENETVNSSVGRISAALVNTSGSTITVTSSTFQANGWYFAQVK